MSAVEDRGEMQADVHRNKRHQQPALGLTSANVNRTLLDVIRDEEPHASLFGHKDKKSWKAFRDRLRLRRAGAAWTSSIHIPASDIPIRTEKSHIAYNRTANGSQRPSIITKRNSVRFTTVSNLNAGDGTNPDESPESQPFVSSSSRPVMTRGTSIRVAVGSDMEMNDPPSAPPDISDVGDLPPPRSFQPRFSRHNSIRFPPSGTDSGASSEGNEERHGSRKLAVALAEERALSAREAVAAQEAAEAEAARATAEESNDEEEGEIGNGDDGGERAPPLRMSLMDLLEETDREMGWEGSKYTVTEVSAEDGEEDDEGEVENTCCVCMVRHKGSAFIPCGHTFCRLCSRELWVQRGNCPLCNGFILEILDIF